MSKKKKKKKVSLLFETTETNFITKQQAAPDYMDFQILASFVFSRTLPNFKYMIIRVH